MFERYRTNGIIIKKEDRGEADQFLTIWTKDFGKLEILGKGIRKITSKLRSGADIFYLSEIEFIQGKTYKTLTDAILLEKFKNLRKSLKKLALASRISEICAHLIKGAEPDEKIWILLNETFYKLNSLETKNWKLEILYHYFLWNFLSILGYKAELYHCVICRKKLLPDELYFSSGEGGVICKKCFGTAGTKEVKKVKPEVIKILRLILKRDWKILSRLKIEEPEQKSLNIISSVYLTEVCKLT